jgi:hypothetical protein
MLRSIRPKRATNRDLSPDNGASALAWVSSPPASGGIDWVWEGEQKAMPAGGLPHR